MDFFERLFGSGEDAYIGVIIVIASFVYGGVMLYFTLRKRPSSRKKRSSKQDVASSGGDLKSPVAGASTTTGATTAAPPAVPGSTSVGAAGITAPHVDSAAGATNTATVASTNPVDTTAAVGAPTKGDRVSFLANSDHSHHRVKAPTQVFTLPPLRIILTDDAVSLLKVTKRALEVQGCSVIISESGVESLEIMKSRRDEFDLWITDIQMPVMDGPESVRLFRNWEEEQLARGASTLSKMFIVGVSANGDDETRKEALGAGMDLFLPKPMNYAYLSASLQGSRLLQEINDKLKGGGAAE